MLTHCLLCAAECAITVRVEDFDTFLCPECGEEFSLADVEKKISQMSATVRACRAAQAMMATIGEEAEDEA